MGKIVDGIYYDSNDKPTFAGIVEIDGKFYYAGEDGIIIKGQSKVVHSSMSNHLVKHGTYYFDKDGVLIPSSYKKPHKVSRKKTKRHKNVRTVGYVILAAAVLILIPVLLSVLTKNHLDATKKTTPSEITVSVSDYKDEVYLCSNQAQAYYKGESTLEETVKLTQNVYKPFVFRYEINNADSAVLLLGEKNDFSDGVQYVLDLKNKELSVDNLKTGTQYYFKVTASAASGGKKEVTGSFKTADTNRFIYLRGLYNTRDIGGYETVDHKRENQEAN